MKIEFTGRKTEVPEPLRKLGERKLQKLARVLPGITRVHVILSNDRHRQLAEVNVRSPGLDLAAREGSADFGLSITAAFDKLTRQAQHRVGKRLDLKRRGRPPASIPSPLAPGTPGGAEAPRRAIRVSRVKVPSLTQGEAALVLAREDAAFVLFKDPLTSRLRILHRRKDGLLGLLEPEA